MVSSLAHNGILIMLGASGLFAAFDGLVKHLSSSFTPGEIAFVRFGFGALMMFRSLFHGRVWLDRQELFLLILRGLLGAGLFYAMILAILIGNLSVTILLLYTSPVWALIAGAYFLGEQITLKRLGGVAFAIVGIMVLIDPWKQGIGLGNLYALLAGALAGLGHVLVRYLRTRHDPHVIYAFHCSVGTLCSIPLVLGHAHIPELADGMMLLAAALVVLLAHLTMNYGYRFIRAAEGSTLLMNEAVCAAALGIIIFREPLTVGFIVGAGMIIGGGIYLGLQN